MSEGRVRTNKYAGIEMGGYSRSTFRKDPKQKMNELEAKMHLSHPFQGLVISNAQLSVELLCALRIDASHQWVGVLVHAETLGTHAVVRPVKAIHHYACLGEKERFSELTIHCTCQ
jgi:hypothetical protein